LEVLTQKRFEVGSAAWTCLYQGQPAAAEGVVWHREWWQYYAVAPEKFLRKIVSLDPAFKTGQQNDFSVMQAWGKTETSFYLLACWRGRVEYPKLKTMLIAFAEQWRPDAVLIEDTASGQSLIQELRATTSLPLRPINPDRDKIARAQACTPQLECGSVYLPQAAPWLNEFLDEVSAFPRAPHDDQLDCASQALNYFREDGSILNSWAAAMAGAHAAGDQATVEQKAQLAKFASHGLPSVPYYGVNGSAQTLAEAQKQSLSGEARGQFSAARDLGKTKAAGRPRPVCPKCGNTQLAICGEFRGCVCGWNSRLTEVAA
jgi:predicted phage terminase large subunit-like protein